MSRELLREALHSALGSFAEGSAMWANCQSAIERADTLLVDGKFVSFQTRRAVLSILNEALERVIDSGLMFLIQDMADFVEKVEALGLWKAEAVENMGSNFVRGCCR